MKKQISAFLLVLLVGFLLAACTSYKKDKNEVVLWELSDPQQLNPIIAADATAFDINNNLFQPLTNFDYRTLKLVPVLADSLPNVKIDSCGHMLITFQIRKEAKWDNGTSITAKDVLFTLKAIKDSSVNDESLRTYYDMISDVTLYPDNQRKFTVVCNIKYMYGPISVGINTYIMPEYVYDSAKYLENFTIKQIHDDKNVQSDPRMIAFAKEFNSEKFSRNPKYVSGSGAYKFTEWVSGQRVVTERKNDWWGNSLAGTNCFFDANPSKLIYQTISDMTTAVVSLKARNLDAIKYIRPSDFSELIKSDKFNQEYVTYNPLRLSYYFIGLNMNNPKFAGALTRQAIAHLFDVQKLIKDVYYGYAKQVIGPITPMDSLNYDYSINPYEFNIDTAKALLASDGWRDSDGDGVLDKFIDGKKSDFTVDYLCNSGNDQWKKVGMIFQEAARKVGIKVTITQQDFNVFQDNLKKHNFEMFMSAWTFQPGPQDFKQIFYTTSALNNGSNWINFGNASTDALLDSIRTEMNDNKRAVMYKRFQKILHQTCGYIYLCAPEALMAIDKRFSNAYPSSNNPFYWEAGFKAEEGK